MRRASSSVSKRRDPSGRPVRSRGNASRPPAQNAVHQWQKFAKHYQVNRNDVRTYGLSELPTRPYSDVEDLASLLRALHLKKAHLVGLSLGGRIIIDFALEHAEMVASLVPVGPGLSGF